MTNANQFSENTPAEFAQPDRAPTACFAVHGAADPGLLPRVVGLWAKRGLTPSRWHSVVCGAGNRELHIDIDMPGLSSDLAAQIACELRQIWGVSQVLMSVDRDRLSA